MQVLKKIAQIVFVCVVGSQCVHAELVDKIVAVVNDNVITNQELQDQVVIQKEQLKQKQIPQPASNVFKAQVLKHMIDTEVQLQLAKANDIKIGDEQVTNAINTIAKNNKMSVADLKKSIASIGETWGNYRKSIKKEVLLSTIQQKSIGQIMVSDEQVNDYLKANKQQVALQYHVKDLLLALPQEPSSKQLVAAMNQMNELLPRLKSGSDEFISAEVKLASGMVSLRGADLGIRPLAALPKMFAEKVTSMKKGDISGPIRASNGLHIIKLVDIKGQY